MSTTNNNQTLTTDIERQRDYVNGLKSKGETSYSLVAAQAFVEGMRDSGYKSTATAIYEFVDNSIQAGASTVDVLHTTVGKSKEIDNIAIIDNGHGMEPEMIRAAVMWGGTHRAGDRSGFGRYGFGLPSAAVSISRSFHVYSKMEGQDWHCVHIDLDDIAAGKYTNTQGIVVAPQAKKVDLPKWIIENSECKLEPKKLKSGTIIILGKPDRLSTGFRKSGGFHEKMLQHLGLTYRYLLKSCPMYVDGERVEKVDPLFLDPTARFYDVGNGIKAEARPPLEFEAKAQGTNKSGFVRLRFSYMPPKFQQKPEGEKGRNARFPIMSENNAHFIVTRAGRQIDLVTRAAFPKEKDNRVIVNYDRNWAVELDFDPELDEEFGITVNKQQVHISERMWSILDSHGVGQAVRSLWEQFRKDKAKESGEDSQKDKNKPSEAEIVMAKTEKVFRKPTSVNPEKEKKAKENLEKEADSEAQKSGKPKEEIVKKLHEETKDNRYKVVIEHVPEGPFYRPDTFGIQKRIYINSQHRFYTDVYARPESTARVKAALELLLFTLAESELDANHDIENYYISERGEWSRRLQVRLAELDKDDPVEDAESAAEED